MSMEEELYRKLDEDGSTEMIFKMARDRTDNNNNNKTLFIHRQIRDCCPVHGCVHTLR